MRQRLRARLRSDERGFTLIETVVAVVIIFASLLALAYTATIGFTYEAYSRERTSGAGIADQIAEEVRGLAYAKIQSGLLTSDVAADPNAVTSCGGDPAGTYRFESCAGEKIVHATGLPATPPLVPNSGTISAGYPVAYDYRVYVTNNDPTANPYRVTVIVTWASNRFPDLANEVRAQSLFWSPEGCTSAATHPFSGPCQPFFYAEGQVEQLDVTVEGDYTDLPTFTSAEILGPTVESSAQVEQVSQVQTDSESVGVSLTNTTSTTDGGGDTVTSVADGDPSTSSPTYQTATVTGSASTLTESSGLNQYVVLNASGSPGSATAATEPDVVELCPLTGTAETDLVPCGHGSIRQVGTATSVLHAHDISVHDIDVGDATLASVGPPGSTSPTTAFSDRDLVTGEDGLIRETVTRSLGTIGLLGLPQNATPPVGWTGYLMTLDGYSDTTIAEAGTSTVAPTATISSGTLSYWNGTGYTALNAASLGTAGSIPFAAVTSTSTIGGKAVEVTITGSATREGKATSQTIGSLATTRTAAEARAGSPIVASFLYEIKVVGSTVVSLNVTVDLGQIVSRTTYKEAPGT